VDHLLSVGSGEFLEVSTLGLRKPMGQPVDLRNGVGFLLDRLACGLVFLPHGDNHERQKHGVDHAQGCVDEASDVIVALARVSGNEALYQLEPSERGEANRPDHERAINYGE
jgi:hypothetical protein